MPMFSLFLQPHNLASFPHQITLARPPASPLPGGAVAQVTSPPHRSACKAYPSQELPSAVTWPLPRIEEAFLAATSWMTHHSTNWWTAPWCLAGWTPMGRSSMTVYFTCSRSTPRMQLVEHVGQIDCTSPRVIKWGIFWLKQWKEGFHRLFPMMLAHCLLGWCFAIVISVARFGFYDFCSFFTAWSTVFVLLWVSALCWDILLFPRVLSLLVQF